MLRGCGGLLWRGVWSRGQESDAGASDASGFWAVGAAVV